MRTKDDCVTQSQFSVNLHEEGLGSWGRQQVERTVFWTRNLQGFHGVLSSESAMGSVVSCVFRPL